MPAVTITANWETGNLSNRMISRQYDNNRYMVQFAGYPEDGAENLIFYLLVFMKTEKNKPGTMIPPVQLSSDQWTISNYFTQLEQQIQFQLCIQNESGTFEAHSPIFNGVISDSLEHDGEDIDIDTSALFDYYREYVNNLIVAAGAVVIDTELDPTSGNPVANRAVAQAFDQVNGRLEELEQTGGSGADVPTEVRQALYRLFNNNAFSSDAGFTSDIAVLQSWATEVTDITISQSAISISGATTSQLTAVTSPAGGLVTWTSSNPAVATVSSTGLVTGVGNGTAKIIASCGGKKAVCTVTVSGLATLTGITATYTQSGTVYTTASLSDLTSDLVVTADYDDSTTATLTSSDYTLSGTIAEGTQTITVSYGGYTDTFTVTVTRVDTSIYNWDFTSSLVDSKQNVEAVLTGATRDSNGVTFNALTDFISLCDVSAYNTGQFTVEIDFGDFVATGANQYPACLATGTSFTTYNGIASQSNGWMIYRTSNNKKYFTDIAHDVFDNATFKFVYDISGEKVWRVYADDVLVMEDTSPHSNLNNRKKLGIAFLPANSVVKAVRVYAGVV